MATLKIKVPIYISSILEESFYSYPEMCQCIEHIINAYNNRRPDEKLSITQRAKLKQKVIKLNPLAELNQRIFDSSNGFIVNKVNIL